MTEVLIGWAALPLRIIIGMIFIGAGYSKLKDLKAAVGMMMKAGVAPAGFWAFVVGFTEFFGGIAVLIGLFSRVAVSLLAIIMLVAMYVKKFQWKKSALSDFHDNLLIIAILIALFFLGSGNLSFDQPLAWIWG